MKFWKKVTLCAICALIPTPNIEIFVKIDIDGDNEPDIALTYKKQRIEVIEIE